MLSYFWLVLENAAGKCTSPCVRIFAPLKSATDIVTQPACEGNTTCANLPPITSVDVRVLSVMQVSSVLNKTCHLYLIDVRIN